MHLLRFGLLFCLLVHPSVWAQQTATTSAQGVVLLQQALGALAGTTSLADVTLTGTAQRSEARTNSNNVPAGTWTGPDGKAHPQSQHNLMTDSSWFFPALTVGRLVSSQNSSVLLVGPETRNGLSVVHLTVSQRFPDMPDDIASLLQHLSQVDVFLDSPTQLPVALAFNQHPDN